ncbi:hypothetical protein MKZ38_010557 [Zalerion maritima]|uniref:Uncharacterized protein n=1 Tax=Zalerion maritima TaxID=339359 RepID=A0AAD5RGH7_9PEZI|nr:hypothetical protein MKZ38_010557 [Zalerion maritima]
MAETTPRGTKRIRQPSYPDGGNGHARVPAMVNALLHKKPRTTPRKQTSQGATMNLGATSHRPSQSLSSLDSVNLPQSGIVPEEAVIAASLQSSPIKKFSPDESVDAVFSKHGFPPDEAEVEARKTRKNRTMAKSREEKVKFVTKMTASSIEESMKTLSIDLMTDWVKDLMIGDHKDTDVASTEGGDSFDLIGAIAGINEIAIEFSSHLGPKDVLNLYSVSKDYHNTLNSNLASGLSAILARKASTALKVFPYKLYRSTCILLPANSDGWRNEDLLYKFGQAPMPRKIDIRYSTPNRPLKQHQGSYRAVPSLKWFQMVLLRSKCCRDILSCLARAGCRTPASTHETLLKIWLLMDVCTTRGRKAMLQNKQIFTEIDLWNAQHFVIKLGLRFNDPIYGPQEWTLPELMLGQRGLYTLWQLLTRDKFNRNAGLHEVVRMKVKYDMTLPFDWPWDTPNLTYFGVKPQEVGRGHLEGWGTGFRHLKRIDELVPYEAVRRRMGLDDHIVFMVLWGFVNMDTGENYVPLENELYLSDEEHQRMKGEPFNFTEHFVAKARYHAMTEEEKERYRRKYDDKNYTAADLGIESDDISTSNYNDESDSNNINANTLPNMNTRSASPNQDHSKLKVPKVRNRDSKPAPEQKLHNAPHQSKNIKAYDDEELKKLAEEAYEDDDLDYGWDGFIEAAQYELEWKEKCRKEILAKKKQEKKETRRKQHQRQRSVIENWTDAADVLACRRDCCATDNGHLDQASRERPSTPIRQRQSAVRISSAPTGNDADVSDLDLEMNSSSGSGSSGMVGLAQPRRIGRPQGPAPWPATTRSISMQGSGGTAFLGAQDSLDLTGGPYCYPQNEVTADDDSEYDGDDEEEGKGQGEDRPARLVGGLRGR